jgi:hypothetical protein
MADEYADEPQPGEEEVAPQDPHAGDTCHRCGKASGGSEQGRVQLSAGARSQASALKVQGRGAQKRC